MSLRCDLLIDGWARTVGVGERYDRDGRFPIYARRFKSYRSGIKGGTRSLSCSRFSGTTVVQLNTKADPTIRRCRPDQH
jgi:hypothetical protein